MIKRIFYVISIFLLFSCSSDNESEDVISNKPDPELEIRKIGEKEIKFESEELDPERVKALLHLNLHVNDLNEYIITGITQIDRNLKWGGFILNTTDTLSKQYLELPVELNIDGNQYGGELNSKVVENNNLLVFGTLNNSKCIIAKYNSNGERLWFKVLEGEFSDLQIVNIIQLKNDYYFLGRRSSYYTNGAASLITNVGKMSMDGNIIFNKVLKNFSLGYNIENYNENSFLITSAKFLYRDDNQSFETAYDKVQPHVINIDISGNIIWESNINELTTDLFHPLLFYVRKGTDGIYCVYNRRSMSDEAKLTKLDLNGNVLWTKPITGIKKFIPYNTFRRIYDITLDADNNIYLVGYTAKDLVWGPTSVGVAKFDSNGAYLNSYTNYDFNNGLFGDSIEFDRHGNLVIASENHNNDLTLFKLNKNLDLL